MNVLQVIDQGFRTTVEEQDDTILWLSGSLVAAGAEIAVLLVGSAVEYAVQSRPQPHLTLGNWQQTYPANIARDVRNLITAGAKVHVVSEDLVERGLVGKPMIYGITNVRRSEVPRLYETADQVWQW